MLDTLSQYHVHTQETTITQSVYTIFVNKRCSQAFDIQFSSILEIMKTAKKTASDGKPSSKDRKITKQKPQFKKPHQRNRGAGGKKSGKSNGGGGPNRFTQAEERRLDKIRQQNERRAEKEAKQLMARKEKKRKTKIFAKKNRHGQPLMSGRMELLLEKIQKRI